MKSRAQFWSPIAKGLGEVRLLFDPSFPPTFNRQDSMKVYRQVFAVGEGSVDMDTMLGVVNRMRFDITSIIMGRCIPSPAGGVNAKAILSERDDQAGLMGYGR